MRDHIAIMLGRFLDVALRRARGDETVRLERDGREETLRRTTFVFGELLDVALHRARGVAVEGVDELVRLERERGEEALQTIVRGAIETHGVTDQALEAAIDEVALVCSNPAERRRFLEEVQEALGTAR
jgi:hypothetical protein